MTTKAYIFNLTGKLCFATILCIGLSNQGHAQFSINLGGAVPVSIDLTNTKASDGIETAKYKKSGSPSGVFFDVLTGLTGFQVGFGFGGFSQDAERTLGSTTLVFDNQYYLGQLIFSLPLPFINLIVGAGAGQFSMVCGNSECTDNAFKDAEAGSSNFTVFSGGIAIPVGMFYSLYASAYSISGNETEFKQASKVSNPITIKYDPSAVVITAGIRFGL